VLAATAVGLALVLLAVASGPAEEAAPAYAQPRTSTDDPAGEPIAQALCRHESLPPGEALRPNHATPRGVESRASQPVALLVPKGGMPAPELLAWRASLQERPPAEARPPLHVLFCTWLT
jgi:hypothetical protein